MYYFYRKSNRGHGICPLYRGCPPFGESVIRGFTVCTCIIILEFLSLSMSQSRTPDFPALPTLWVAESGTKYEQEYLLIFVEKMSLEQPYIYDQL